IPPHKPLMSVWMSVCLFTRPDSTKLCFRSQKSLLDRVSTGSGSDLVSDQHSFASKVRKSLLDRVSTGSGSDLVSDQHAIFLMVLDSDGFTRWLSLPVLTRSKRHPDF